MSTYVDDTRTAFVAKCVGCGDYTFSYAPTVDQAAAAFRARKWRWQRGLGWTCCEDCAAVACDALELSR